MKPTAADVFYDITYYLNGASEGGSDRAYAVLPCDSGLKISVTDIDSLQSSLWTLTLVAAGVGAGNPDSVVGGDPND